MADEPKIPLIHVGNLNVKNAHCPFLFYDHLRWIAIQKLTNVTPLADIHVTIYINVNDERSVICLMWYMMFSSSTL